MNGIALYEAHECDCVVILTYMKERTRYRVGIDVGTNSVGLSAVEVDDEGMPISLLSTLTQIHDSGVNPDQAKAAVTRLASAGVARRTRRLIQRRRKRLKQLDKKLEQLGWPITDTNESGNPYLAWETRAMLAEKKLPLEELPKAMSIAVRHMARHRGWRSPYERIESLYSRKPDSDLFVAFKNRVTERTGVVFDDEVTLAQVVIDSDLSPDFRLRSAPSEKYGDKSVQAGVSVAGKPKEGILGGKLMQSDNANELWKIAQVQNLSSELVQDLIDHIFVSESPKGKQAERAGKDALPGQSKFFRATKADLSFQKFRIVAAVANLRIKTHGVERKLSGDEKLKVIHLLMNALPEEAVKWIDVAELLGIDRQDLVGTAAVAIDGEMGSSFPPVNVTNQRILGSRIKSLVNFWADASEDERAALVKALSNAEELKESDAGAEVVREFLSKLDDSELEKLEKVNLPMGRAAYSQQSLVRLTERMLADDVDLHEARKREFGVDDSWVPPADPIGKPVGNPAVDRVLKIVNRWLMAAVAEWGAPERVNIENIRSGFISEAQVRIYKYEQDKQRKRNLAVLEEAHERLGITDLRPSDLTRYLAVRRQNCKCLYCGSMITYQNSEMDHIVPRKGAGSTNTRTNLVAVCVRCNRAKSNVPFALWAPSSGITGVSVSEAVERVRTWTRDEGLTLKQDNEFRKEVIFRLKKTTEDEEIDNRSIESVAWMANELRHRIDQYFKCNDQIVKVSVYRGAITAEARKATGFTGRLNLIGGKAKTRMDRRHHAMDATVIAMMRDSVAKTLMQRSSIRDAERFNRAPDQSWKHFTGDSIPNRKIFAQWQEQMERLLELFNEALAEDKVPVMQNVRLRLGSGAAHEATINKFRKKRLGDSWSLEEIDCASTEQMWVALQNCPDFDPKTGLPEDESRSIRVKHEWFTGMDRLDILPKLIAAIPVRGGWAELGSSIHHVRIYRIPGKKDSFGMIRVYSHDLIKHQHEDLLNVALAESSISMRTADAKVRRAVLEGKAEYLGWLVPGVEVELSLDGVIKPGSPLADFVSDFPTIKSWKLTGYENKRTLNFSPRLLSKEGYDSEKYSEGTSAIVQGSNGLRISLSSLFASGTFRVIFRDALGRIRESSNRGLPCGWSV